MTKFILSAVASSLLYIGSSMSANAAPVHSLGDQAPIGFNTNNFFSGNARCSGSHLKSAGLAFNVISGSD